MIARTTSNIATSLAKRSARKAATSAAKRKASLTDVTTSRTGRLLGFTDKATKDAMKKAAAASNQAFDSAAAGASKSLALKKAKSAAIKAGKESAATAEDAAYAARKKTAQAAEELANRKKELQRLGGQLDDLDEAKNLKNKVDDVDAAKNLKNKVDDADGVAKKTTYEKIKRGAKITAAGTLAGTVAYSGIEAATGGKKFSETFEKNWESVVGETIKIGETTGTTVLKPVVSGTLSGVSKSGVFSGITGFFSGIGSTFYLVILFILIMFMVSSSSAKPSN